MEFGFALLEVLVSKEMAEKVRGEIVFKYQD